jgi:polysaccharide export outer membrane protein
MKRLRLCALMLAVVSPVMVTYGQVQSDKPASDNKTVFPKAEVAAKDATSDVSVVSATKDPNYVIGPDDELVVTVWKEPDISRTVLVRPDGKISLPLLKDVQAAGFTPMQLTTEITTRLTKFVSAPEVTVIVSRISPPRVFVVGEVGRAGAYSLVTGMTVLEAVSSAGGLTPFAKQSKIYVLRTENAKQIRIPVNYKEMLKGRRPEDNISLKAGDSVVVP